MVLYRLLISLAAPLILTFAVLRMGGMTARLGLVGPAVPGPHLWVHAASNGELGSARPVIEALLVRNQDLRVLITANNISAVQLARSWGLPRVEPQLASLDLRWITARVLRQWSVKALVIIENELWPNRVQAARAAGCSVVVIGARLSARSASRWRRFPGVIGPTLKRLRWVSAQDPASAQRFGALGLAPEQVRPILDLKAFYRPPAPPSDLDALSPLYDRTRTVLAASTHPGEEAIILDAFRTAQDSVPDLHLILAPRHPQRREEVMRLITDRGLSVAQRSRREVRAQDTAITLVDTLGEMQLWYRLAGRCFVGGSLVSKGGHTPYEPAAFDCAILHGPDTANFSAAYEQLRVTDAAIEVRDTHTLASALIELDLPERQRDIAARARAALPQPGDLEGLLAEIEALLS